MWHIMGGCELHRGFSWSKMKERSHLKDPRYRWNDNKRKKLRLDSPVSGMGKGAGHVLVNVATHLWHLLYAGNLITFSHAVLQITSLLYPAECIN